MPSKKYYRCCLPNDVLQIIGKYAGDFWYQLEFTYSTKRKFLSTIRLVPRRKEFSCVETVLKKDSWLPVQMGNINSFATLMDILPITHLSIFHDSLRHIHKLLAEIHDYTLKHKY